MEPASERPRDGREKWARASHVGSGALRVALLFSSAAIALSLILTSILERRTHQSALFSPAIDRMTTGTVETDRGLYTVRRSVLQTSPRAVCIIRPDGSRRGAC